MGFYGQVVYEFTKLFSNINVTPSNTSEEPVVPDAENQDVFFKATDMWETINIKPTNKWIQLRGNGPTDITKTIEIGHSTPGAADDTKTTKSLEKIDTLPEGVVDSDTIQLKNGDFLKIATTKFDKAGHFIDSKEEDDNPSYEYYKLPTAAFSIIQPEGAEPIEPIIPDATEDTLQIKGDGQWVELSNDNGALKIAHIINTDIENIEVEKDSTLDIITPNIEDIQLTKDEFLTSLADDNKTSAEINAMRELLIDLTDDDKIIKLQSGDLLEAQKLIQDNNGHVVGMEPYYFKLPVSATDLAFDEQGERIAALEHRLDNSSKNTVTPPGATQIRYGTYESDIVPRAYSVGDIGTMYSNAENYTTLTETIGTVDGDNSITAAFNRLIGDSKSVVTVSEAIQKIVDKIKYQDTIIALIADKLDIGL